MMGLPRAVWWWDVRLCVTGVRITHCNIYLARLPRSCASKAAVSSLPTLRDLTAHADERVHGLAMNLAAATTTTTTTDGAPAVPLPVPLTVAVEARLAAAHELSSALRCEVARLARRAAGVRGRLARAAASVPAAGGPPEVSFTDTGGNSSTLRVGNNGRLQWWSGGRCLAKSVAALGWGSDTRPAGPGGSAATSAACGEPAGACDNVLTTSTGQPRAVVARPGLAALKVALQSLAHAAGAKVTTEAALEKVRLANRARRANQASLAKVPKGLRRSQHGTGARADHRGARRVRQRRREAEGALAMLRSNRAPVGGGGSFRDCASIDAPLAGMQDTLAELRGSAHSAGAAGAAGAGAAPFGGVRWADMPPALSMTAGLGQTRGDKLGDAARFERKRRQCDAFAAAIAALGLPDDTVVVDFGCGSCGLTLPLAFSFPRLCFVGVDLKAKSLELMAARAAAAGLANVRTVCRSIGAFGEPFGLAIALHACGQASDEAVARVSSRPISPRWGSIRFRQALRTYAPCGPSVRVVSLTKSRKKYPPEKDYRSFWLVSRPRRCVTVRRTRPGPFNFTPMGVNPMSSGSPRVRPMGRTCGEPDDVW